MATAVEQQARKAVEQAEELLKRAERSPSSDMRAAMSLNALGLCALALTTMLLEEAGRRRG